MADQDSPIIARALAVAEQRGIARARDFVAAGIAPAYVSKLCAEGRLMRLGRGLYQLPEAAGSDANHNLAEAARMVPTGVICLLSATRFHGLTTQVPNAVWILIPHKARTPQARALRLEIVRTNSPRAMTDGIIEAVIEGVTVPVTSPARTVADCFKYRRRVGLDVAIEALRDALQQRICSPDDLMHYAEQNRVGSIVKPYIEALTT